MNPATVVALASTPGADDHPVRNGTQRQASEALLAGQKRALEMLAKGAPLEDVLATLVRLTEEATPGAIGAILAFEPGTQRVGMAVAPSLQPRCVAALRAAPLSPPDAGLQNRCSAPIIGRGGRTLGSFALYSRATGCPGSDPQLLASVTDLAGIAIERAHFEHALCTSRAALEAELADSRLLQQTSAALIGEHSNEALYEKLVDAAARIMHSDFASMQMLTSELAHDGELNLLAYRGFPPEAAAFWRWVRFDSQSTCGAALRTGERVVVPDVEACAFMAGSEDLRVYRQAGIRAVQTTPLLSRNGNMVGMLSTHWRVVHEPPERALRLLDIVARQAADLIEHRNAQERVRQREERLHAIFDSAVVGAAILLPDTRFVQVNSALCTITGHGAEELRRLDCRTLTHPDDRTAADALLEDLLAGRTASAVVEKRYMRKDGVPIWVQNSVSLTRDAAGAPLHIVLLCQDITKRRRAEQALAESHAQLREQADELARFNRAAVGRELRMIELKNEINALYERLGEQPRHRLAFDRDGHA